MSAQHTPVPWPVASLRGKDPADMESVELQALVYGLRDQRDELLSAFCQLTEYAERNGALMTWARALISRVTGSAS